MQTNFTNPQSICILRLSAIGDVCHAVATVQAIQRRHPEAKITWVIGKVEAQLVTELNQVEFIVFDKKIGLKAYKDLWQRFKGRKFDILLHMQTAIRASLATLCIKATEKWGFDKSRAKEAQWLFTNRQIQAQNSPHVADGFWGFAKAIGVDSNSSPVWDMPLSEDDIKWRDKLLMDDRPYIVISPAASKEQRNWLPERYAVLSDYANIRGYRVIVTGGPTEMEQTLGKEIFQACQFPALNLIAKTSLSQLLTLIAKADLVIAPDSGPAHMATIVNTPVLALYAHSNPKRTGPYHSFDTTVSIYEKLLKEQTGKSIAENPWGKRVKGENLMSLISIESVIAAFDLSIVDTLDHKP